MPAKPLLLLDVDGVLCPIGSGPGEPMRTLEIKGHPFIFTESLPARLARLGQRFALIWATSWEQGANRDLAPVLGLPQLPAISFAGLSARQGRTWKLPAIKRYVAEQPMAWVDDDLRADAHAWAQSRIEPTLLLDVNPSWGLVEAHVEILIEFADRLSADRELHEGPSD